MVTMSFFKQFNAVFKLKHLLYMTIIDDWGKAAHLYYAPPIWDLWNLGKFRILKCKSKVARLLLHNYVLCRLYNLLMSIAGLKSTANTWRHSNHGTLVYSPHRYPFTPGWSGAHVEQYFLLKKVPVARGWGVKVHTNEWTDGRFYISYLVVFCSLAQHSILTSHAPFFDLTLLWCNTRIAE